MIETAHIFTSRNQQLVAIKHAPEQKSTSGLILVVGGPQTRVGSHRMFVYLARALAKRGVHVFRFDYTGAGDSEGLVTNFTDIQEDISAAIAHFTLLQPRINKITLWGLCDAASAILLYVQQSQDQRIQGLVLLNPWVRQASTHAKTVLGSYYIKRLLSKSFWLKLFKGQVKLGNSMAEIQRFSQLSKQEGDLDETFIYQMQQGLTHFSGQTMIVLSEHDLTADEFRVLVANDEAWQRLLQRHNISQVTVNNANHTFTNKNWQELVIMHTLSILNNLSSG